MMTIRAIRQLSANWTKTLNSRSVWTTLIDGRRRRIIGVGRKYVYVIENGKRTPISPYDIYAIDGL